ncbi:hypothetical protein JZ786_24335 [Alicyclobacillus mengziensis]|uniref:Transposase IS4-like domain-containing protein n=1 Tax=Alicyclobacillus mengziensis TaxID=2931921 RepID=A0A9X7VYK7_9BACL|nr:hypothetical protein [Alicyclobacillus mengziensis]QSO47473.1 hypothetical protein JZ786_24335 [Alicyclobacillus mengziensis]
MSVIPEVKQDFIGWRLGRVITVVDRGFNSKTNLRELQKTGGHYIAAGEKMSSGKQSVEDALALECELSRLKELDGDAHTKVHCALQSHQTYKRFLKSDKHGNLRSDKEAVKAAERLDGKYLIRTSDDTLSVYVGCHCCSSESQKTAQGAPGEKFARP